MIIKVTVQDSPANRTILRMLGGAGLNSYIVYMKSLRHIIFRSICIFLVSAFLCPVFFLRAYALENWADDCYVLSEGACLMDADSGVVLFGKSMDNAYYPASITKVLTALIVLENCENLSEQVTFSYDAVHIEEENSTIIGASEGDKLSVLDCLYCLLFQSANEVANALAEHVGAKHPELKEDGMDDRGVFVKMMNLKAQELGCKGSHFNNPSGLTDENHYTTAFDMCCIMTAAIKNERFLDIEGHTYWTHAPIRRYPNADDPWNTVYPKHSMIKRNSSQYYSGTIAGKTGYTMNAGNTLVTACRRGAMTLVTCVLNAHANHYNDTRRLMDFGFDNFTSLAVTDYDNTNSVIASDYRIGDVNMVDSVTLGIDPRTRITIPKGGNFVEVKKSLEISDPAEGGAPARLTYTYGDRVVGTADLKLMDIGETSELTTAAQTDPLLANALGIQIVTSTEAADEAQEEGQESTEEGSSGPAETVTAADGAEAGSIAGSGPETAGSAQNGSGQAPAGNSLLEKELFGLKLGRILKYAACVIGGIAGLFVLLTVIGTLREKSQASRRAQRRAERLERTGDMTGTQQIRMDLEMQRRLRKKKRKR